ncbi:hypothetical protein THAOC_30404, partial [Thalassiosira oceanica]
DTARWPNFREDKEPPETDPNDSEHPKLAAWRREREDRRHPRHWYPRPLPSSSSASLPENREDKRRNSENLSKRSGLFSDCSSVPTATSAVNHRANEEWCTSVLGQRRRGVSRRDYERVTKRAGHDEVAGAPAAAKAPQKLTDVAAAIKIAELQAGLEALKQGHSVVVDMLNAKVNSLRAENDSQKREITGLNSAFQWAYNYKEIPRRHWLEQGRSEECADAMENLLKGMKQAIENLWVGGNRETITINFDLRDGDGSFIRADHDESLMPYWKELAAALKHWSEYHANGKYLHVQIFDIELPKAVLGILLPAFEQSRIETIYFYDTIHQKSRHTGEMADFVKKVLQTNLFITRLLFSFIKFSQEDVKIICGAIKARNVGGRIIEFLRLVHCFEGGIDTHILNMILASVATANGDVALSLWYNGMSSREAAVITEFLRLNPSLKRLTLRGNRFDDGDAALLADALSSNTHLGLSGLRKMG